MIKHNRIVRFCLAAAVAFFLLISSCTCALAAAPDLDRKCSITFSMVYGGTPLTGGNLKMCRIATWVIRDGAYTFEWVPELADSGLDLNDRDSEVFARRVFMLVESRSLPVVAKEIGPTGVVTFNDLDSGLYVVYQTVPAEEFEPINPFCVSLPMSFGDDFVYDVMASPKPRPEKPETTTPDASLTTEIYENEPPVQMPEDTLPQTGQLWWPAWTLAAVGGVLLGLGFVLRLFQRLSAEGSEA